MAKQPLIPEKSTSRGERGKETGTRMSIYLSKELSKQVHAQAKQRGVPISKLVVDKLKR